MLEEARDALPDPSRAHVRAVTSASPAGSLAEVAEVAEEEHADLVVVGSSHRGAVGRVVPGTTADRLMQEAPCAVAVAPAGYHGGAVRRLAVAYDGSPESEASPQAAEALAVELSAAAEEIGRRVRDRADVLFGSLRRALAGSVSGALVHDAGCPVIVTARTALAARRPLPASTEVPA